jgi:hypothetical protein
MVIPHWCLDGRNWRSIAFDTDETIASIAEEVVTNLLPSCYQVLCQLVSWTQWDSLSNNAHKFTLTWSRHKETPLADMSEL